MNLARYVSMPRKHCRVSLLVGGVILFIACVFLGSGFNPSLARICPRYAISCFLNWHLLLFNFRFCRRALSRTLISLEPCSASFVPHTGMSSPTTSTLSTSSNISVITF